MKTRADFLGAEPTTGGEIVLAFAVEHSDKMQSWADKNQGKSLNLEVKGEPRSLNANNYFWALCEEMAQAQRSTQDEMHDLMLYRYGERADLKFEKRLLPAMQKHFDIVLILEDYGDVVNARCFLGSRYYDKESMGRLIEGTINDARDTGISILNPQEVERLVAEWKGEKL